MTIQVVNNSAPAAQAEKPAGEVDSTKSAPEAEKAAEQKEVSESDAGNAEDESEKDESEAEGDEPEAKESEQDETKKKSGSQKSGSQRRKERAERAEAEVTRLQGLMEQMALKGAGDSKPEPKVEASKAADDGEPDPEKFATHVEYVRALTRWEIKQDQKARSEETRKAQLETEHQTAVNSHFERVKAFKEKNEDYSEAVKSLGDLPNNPAVEQCIVSSEHSPEILYALAKDPEEALRICKLPAIAAAREIGKIEARFAGSSEAKKPETKKQTNAPAPVTPVGKGSAPLGKSTNDPTISQKEFEAARRKQMATRKPW